MTSSPASEMDHNPQDGGANLIKYDAACRALAEAKSVDEVKDVHDKAEGMRAYAKQAKNLQLELDAVEIRVRAERRLGEMIQAQKETVGLAPPGRPSKKIGVSLTPISKPTLKAVGIDKELAKRARKMAAIPENEFRNTLAKAAEQVKNPPKRTRQKRKPIDPETTRRMLQKPAQTAYQRNVEVSRSVFTAVEYIKEAQATPAEWLDSLCQGEIDVISERVFPIIDWLIEMRCEYERRYSENLTKGVD